MEGVEPLDFDSYSTITDGSLSKSTSFSLSDSSIDQSNLDNTSVNESDFSKKKSKKVKNKRVELIPPEEKLKKCERRYRTYMEQGDKENAMTELLKLPPLVRLVYGEHSWKYAEACSKLSRGYLEMRGLGPQCVKHAEIAKSVILSGCNADDAEKSLFIKCVAEVYLCLGRGLTAVGEKYKEAENSLVKSWQVLASLSKVRGAIQLPTSTNDDRVQSLKKEIKLSLADVYILMKQPDKAMGCLNYVIKLISEESSSKDKSLIPIYGKMAKAEKARKRSEINYEAVVEYRLKAHEIASSSYKLNSTEVADTAYSLGLAYANIDSENTQKAAETYFNEALNSYKNNLGSDNPNTLKTRDALCKVWTRTEREKEAIKELKETLPIKAEVFGSCSSQVADTHKLIGGIYLSQEDVMNAHKYLKKCLDIEDQLYGTNHWKTKSTANTIQLIGQHPTVTATKTNEKKLRERPKFLSTIKSKN